ncbi:MAG TPA: hypothetical protein CFH84_01370 [Sulfurimonas sp. UBA12504]|nr:MAG: hypothetical protein A2019_03100 [Sulfurimonas sp. GWF2_37_8]DAB30939.1 MAG TPA: hypothetical protein CFH84_01370 [Sulfurimonas sp. UBA12504]
MNKLRNYTKKVWSAFYVFCALFVMIGAELGYIYSTQIHHEQLLDKKLAFVKLSGLPDLAISTEASYVRHRSLSTISSIYKDDGGLLEYFPSTYAISHSHILQTNAAGNKNEK